MRRNTIALAVVLLCASSNPISAQSFNGYCMDTGAAGCMPRFIPFDGLSIDFCEETCSLTNPVNVRGLDAVLYELACLADYDTPYEGARVMILRQLNRDGTTNISWIEESRTMEVVPCP